uniref:Uncharacterized protein n=1 Tax=Eptatretus burgeri TaxID=7764 RepID=A0A8C4PWB5_EPTBU
MQGDGKRAVSRSTVSSASKTKQRTCDGSNGLPPTTMGKAAVSALHKLHQQERKERQGIVLWRRPITTCQYFLCESSVKACEGVLQLNSSNIVRPSKTLPFVPLYIPSTNATSASSTPIYLSVAIIISLGTVSNAFSRSTNPDAISPYTSNLFSTKCLSVNISSVIPLPFINLCFSSSISSSTLSYLPCAESSPAPS